MLSIAQTRPFSRPGDYSITSGTSKSAVIGSLTLGSRPMAKNSRLAHLFNLTPQGPELRLRGKLYSIEYEYIRRGWVNDVHIWLEADGACLAEVDILAQSGLRGPKVVLNRPFVATIERGRSILTHSFILRKEGVELARIREPKALSLSRVLEFEATSGQLDEYIQCFLLYLALRLFS